MDQIKFFETIIEPSTERLGLFGIAHNVSFDGRSFVVTHKISKNVFTEFDGKLSRYLAAVTGIGLPGATVETRIREVSGSRSWTPYPARHLPSVPEALATAATLSLGEELSRNLIVHMTYVVVAFSILGQGLTISPLVKKLMPSA